MNNDYFKNNSVNDIINKNKQVLQNSINLNDILNKNIGKKVVVYQSFNNKEENNIFNGIIENCGDDYIILSDPNFGNWYLFFTKYLNFIKFEEEINFNNNYV